MMLVQRPKAKAVPRLGDANPCTISDRISRITRGIWAMVQQKMENAGINNALVTVIGGLMTAGIIALVAVEWNTGLQVQKLEDRLGYISERVDGFRDDLRRFQDDRRNEQPGSQPNRR